MWKQADVLEVCLIPDAGLLVMAQRPSRLLGLPEIKAADNLDSYVIINSDYGDEYYSDDEYSLDPGVDYTDTICYHPGISNRSLCASGALHLGISSQPRKCQLNSSSGKSLVKQDPQNRSHPKPQKARKRRKKKRPKPSPPSPPETGIPKKVERAQPTETHPPPIHLPSTPLPFTMESFNRWYATRMSHAQPRLHMDTICLESS
jgi:hypothetical protein